MKFAVVLVVILAGCATRQQSSAKVTSIVAESFATSSEAKRVVQTEKDAQNDARIRDAFALGELQATKALHDAIQNTQKTDVSGRHTDTLVPLTVPQRTIDGVIVNPTVEYVRLPQ